ncbi:hypothetical protein HY251_21550 [bacterium]|nr:hypothetical protein [bacterium]
MLSLAPARGGDKGPHGRQPLVVLVSRNPWLMVMGSDSPRFALYDDGLLIFQRATQSDSRRELVSMTLSQTETAALVSSLGIGLLAKLDRTHRVSTWTDQPTHDLHVWIEGKRKTVSVYGRLDPRKVAAQPSDPDDDACKAEREKTPTAFLSVFDKLVGYANDGAKPWLPARVEVMIWPFEYAKDDPVSWPEGWPGIDHADTRKRGSDSYSLFLEKEHLEALRKLMADMKQTQPLLLGGKKWALAWRLPFPEEQVWMGKD